jgi:hypothetical protein
MAVDLAICFIVSLGCCFVAWRLAWPRRVLLLAVFGILGSNINAGFDLLIDVGLLAWALLCLVETGRWVRLHLACFCGLAVFAALDKFTYTVLASFITVMISLDLAIRGRRLYGLALLTGFAGGVVLVWILAGQHLANLPTFIRNGMTLAGQFDKAAGREFPQTDVVIAVVASTLLALAAVLSRSLFAFSCEPRETKPRRFLLLAWLGAMLFMSWKHGFIRADRYHLEFLLGFIPFLGLLLDIIPCSNPAATNWARNLGLACCLALVAQQLAFLPEVKFSATRTLQAIPRNLHDLVNPLAYTQKLSAELEDQKKHTQLPRLCQLIGQQSVDVFGNSQSYAVFNGLNYHPRPVFQGEAALCRSSMQLNENFYLTKPPQFLLFKLDAVDDRFPTMEDAFIFRNALINYAAVESEGPFLLMKSTGCDHPRLTLLREGNVSVGQQIGVEEYGEATLWLEVHLKTSLPGRLRQFLYKSPPVQLRAWCRNTCYQFNAPAPMLEAGFVASPLFLGQGDITRFYRGEELKRPTAYSVEVFSGGVNWGQVLRFRLYKLENPVGQPLPENLRSRGYSGLEGGLRKAPGTNSAAIIDQIWQQPGSTETADQFLVIQCWDH